MVVTICSLWLLANPAVTNDRSMILFEVMPSISCMYANYEAREFNYDPKLSALGIWMSDEGEKL